MEIEDKNSKKIYTVEEFYDLLVRTFLRQARTKAYASGDMDRKLYMWAVKSIQEKIKKDPDNKEYYYKMFDIADKFYEFISLPEVRNAIISGKLDASEFDSMYKEQILGDEKRTYDMSSMFREDYLMKSDNSQTGELGRKLLFMPQKGTSHIYKDAKGNEIIIEEIGVLHMQQWNGVRSHVNKYRVQKQADNGSVDIKEVYSCISIFDMEDPKYQRAVLEELLSQNNIMLSNASGYIGEISDTPESMKGKEGKHEKMIDGMYYYKVNDEYSLRYDGADLSAVVLHEKYESTQKSKKVVPIGTRMKGVGVKRREDDEESR